MSNVYFISDLHLGHKNILNFSGPLREGIDVDEHDALLIDKIASTCNSKRDILYLVGDIALGSPFWKEYLRSIPARKILVRGNHDDKIHAKEYLEVFEDVLGCTKYKRHWVSHFPIHPAELRGAANIHGHVHSSSIRDAAGVLDERYVNVCVEALGGYPINYMEILDGTYSQRRRC